MLFHRASFLLSIVVSHVLAHSRISRHRHLVTDDVSMVVVMADVDMTQGPFAAEDSDYVNTTNDLREAGRAGFSPSLEEDRLTVVDGVPLNFTMTIYDVSSDDTTGAEYENVEVLLWHCDAAGVYSSIEPGLAQEVSGLEDQMWLRGKQVSGADGKVTFRTILPGWYGNRALHYHVRLRLPGEVEFAATTQFFIADSDLALYEDVKLYRDFNPGNITPLSTDALYTGLAPDLAQELTLNLEGTVETGFVASVKLGLEPGSVSGYPGSFEWPPCLLDADGNPPTLPPSGEEPGLPEECFDENGNYDGGESKTAEVNVGNDGADADDSETPDTTEESGVPCFKNTMPVLVVWCLLALKHL